MIGLSQKRTKVILLFNNKKIKNEKARFSSD